MSVERTLSIVKPDAVGRGLIGEVLKRFESAGLKIVAAKLVRLTPEQARAFTRSTKSGRSLRVSAPTCLPGPFSFPCWKAKDRLDGTVKLWEPRTRLKRRRGRFARTGVKMSNRMRCMVPMGPDTAATEIAFFLDLTRSLRSLH